MWWCVEDGEIGVASYESALLELGFKEPRRPANTRMLIGFDQNTRSIALKIKDLFDFKLDQTKDSFDDWNAAFSEAIVRGHRTVVRRSYWTV